ncbi:MAG TPA: hypothetical protein VMV14_09300 [Acidimicrobiales bacterium]|nr:hypothetical protein [Acidimicrobiales bacterium]
MTGAELPPPKPVKAPTVPLGVRYAAAGVTALVILLIIFLPHGGGASGNSGSGNGPSQDSTVVGPWKVQTPLTGMKTWDINAKSDGNYSESIAFADAGTISMFYDGVDPTAPFANMQGGTIQVAFQPSDGPVAIAEFTPDPSNASVISAYGLLPNEFSAFL